VLIVIVTITRKYVCIQTGYHSARMDDEGELVKAGS
jgi:hypothetical protein